MHKRIAVLMTGGSGAIYGYRLLKALNSVRTIDTHLVITNQGKLVIKTELGLNASELEALATFTHNVDNLAAPLSSGSFRLDGTVVVPCSMKTLAGIAMDYEENLVMRAAAIALKEKWPLIIMPRETPLSSIQLKNMLTLSRAGAIIMPPMHPFYFKTKKIEDLVDITIGRVLAMLKIENSLNVEWGRETHKMESETDNAVI